jgi:tetratricopeptide (TPR) repeat protein
MNNINSKELFRTAQRLFIEDKKHECIDVFSKAIDAGEKTQIAYLSRGVAFIKTEQTDDAIKDFSMVVSMNNNNMRAHFYRGIAYLSKADFHNAIRDFDKTIELKPDHGAAFFARGSAYAQSGDTSEAARNFKTALIYSETEAQGFADTFGIFRTQFERTLALMTDESKMPVLELTEDEIDKLKSWLEE